VIFFLACSSAKKRGTSERGNGRVGLRLLGNIDSRTPVCWEGFGADCSEDEDEDEKVFLI
jgi:hypothetical protein